MIDLDTEKLAALHAAATPGEWKTDYDPLDAQDYATLIVTRDNRLSIDTWIGRLEHNWADAGHGERRISWKEAEANAALIAYLRNAVPAILALKEERDALLRNVRAWREWHKRANADDDCEYLNGDGWDDADALASTGMGLVARAALREAGHG